MVPFLRAPVREVRALLQDAVGLLRSALASAKTDVAEGHAVIHDVEGRRAEAQLNTVQHGDQLSEIRVCEPRRVSPRDAHAACGDLNAHPQILRSRPQPGQGEA